MKAERLFFALWPAADWQANCHAALKGLLPGKSGRAIPAHNLHITLAFLGAVRPEQRACVESAAETIGGEAFTLEFTRLAYNPRNRIVWAFPLAAPTALSALVTDLREAIAGCGLQTEHRAFFPHLTLVRKASPMEARELDGIPPWQVQAFSLVRSETLPSGAVYEVVREWVLRPAPASL